MANDFMAIADMVADAFDLSGTEISNLLTATPLLNALTFVPSSNGTTHKYITHTANPVVGFRAENAGRDFDASEDTVVTATLKILDWSWMADKAVADAWRKGPEDFIAREGRRHVQSAMTELEQQLIYGTANDAAGFVGLTGLATINGLSDSMVVNAGGTTADTASSVYLLQLGESDGVCGVYKGDGMPLEFGETIVQNFVVSNLNLPVYYTPACSWFGAQIGGAYSIGRICNLTADSGKGLTDDLIASALAAFPIGRRPTVMAMNRRSLKQLQDSRTATNATGAPAPFPTEAFGVPIIVTDNISSTEALVA